jgi:threonyl-tRNA synthetase
MAGQSIGQSIMKTIHRDGTVHEVFDSDEALETLRHSTSHLMALAVSHLFPGVSLGIGPPTGEGFYYDFQLQHRLTEDDLPRIEAKMEELKSQNLEFEPSILEQSEALDFFRSHGEELKTELIEERKGEVLSSYRLGDLVDFCTGPHVLSTAQLGSFRLLSIAGSYWRGDEHREQLQRIYGTAFFSTQELDDHLKRLEEARNRDHRKLGRELDLYSVPEGVAPGLIFWHPKGAKVREKIEEFLREEHETRGYEFVYTPHIAKSDLWKTSGHYEFFRENMYTLPVDDEEYVLKPMNCPGHILIYKSRKRSYRELPIRLAEFGTVYRYEKSGTLHGMLRVRGFTQDDAHIFCRPDQVFSEVVATLDFAEHLLNTFGFQGHEIMLAVWDSEHTEHYAGKREDWERAESVLIQALEEKGWPYRRQEGEAAFYGPKIDISLIDALGRTWQVTTLQFDFNLPARFNITYADSESREQHVIMLHRALLGSMERFMGILVEHYGGAFPPWLSPVQASVVPVSDRHHEYAVEVRDRLRETGLRVEADLRNEKLGYKIRSAQMSKVPYMLVVGDREVQGRTVSVRDRRRGNLGACPLDDFSRMLGQQVAQRALDV